MSMLHEEDIEAFDIINGMETYLQSLQYDYQRLRDEDSRLQSD